MKTKVINLYEYNELTPEAQERAREWFKGLEDYYFLTEDMEQYALTLLEENGFTAIDMGTLRPHYSLSCCQGDGAMFEFDAMRDGLQYKVRQSGHYCHAWSTDITITDANDDDVSIEQAKQIEEDVLVPMFKECFDYRQATAGKV